MLYLIHIHICNILYSTLYVAYHLISTDVTSPYYVKKTQQDHKYMAFEAYIMPYKLVSHTNTSSSYDINPVFCSENGEQCLLVETVPTTHLGRVPPWDHFGSCGGGFYREGCLLRYSDSKGGAYERKIGHFMAHVYSSKYPRIPYIYARIPMGISTYTPTYTRHVYLLGIRGGIRGQNT